VFLISLMRATCLAYLILVDLITLIILFKFLMFNNINMSVVRNSRGRNDIGGTY
jgi:hypothetical protein